MASNSKYVSNLNNLSSRFWIFVLKFYKNIEKYSSNYIKLPKYHKLNLKVKILNTIEHYLTIDVTESDLVFIMK